MKSCVLCLLAVVTFEWSARAADVASIEAIRAVDHGYLKIPDYEPSSNAVIEVVVSVDDPGKNGTVFCSRNSRWNKESYALCYVGARAGGSTISTSATTSTLRAWPSRGGNRRCGASPTGFISTAK